MWQEKYEDQQKNERISYIQEVSFDQERKSQEHTKDVCMPYLQSRGGAYTVA